LFFDFGQRIPAEKISFVKGYAKTEPGVIRRVFRGQFRAPEAIAFFKMQGVDGPVTDIGNTQIKTEELPCPSL
jgi:hypothetical protein